MKAYAIILSFFIVQLYNYLQEIVVARRFRKIKKARATQTRPHEIAHKQGSNSASFDSISTTTRKPIPVAVVTSSPYKTPFMEKGLPVAKPVNPHTENRNTIPDFVTPAQYADAIAVLREEDSGRNDRLTGGMNSISRYSHTRDNTRNNGSMHLENGYAGLAIGPNISRVLPPRAIHRQQSNTGLGYGMNVHSANLNVLRHDRHARGNGYEGLSRRRHLEGLERIERAHSDGGSFCVIQ